MSQLTKPSEGYFLAKRQMVEAIDGRMNLLHQEQINLPKDSDSVDRHRAISVELRTLENTRSYIRNVLLWDTSQGL